MVTALIALVVLAQGPNTDAEIFVDRGETYLRAGQANGLSVGAGLEVLDAKKREPVGTAVVMEVWDSLARVSLDSKATAHGPLKVARVKKEAAAAPAPVAAPAPGPVVAAAPRAVPIPVPTGPNTLDGHVTINGIDKGRRVIIRNRSNRDWHNCDVRLADGRHYWIGDLDAGDDDGVMLFRFEHDGPPPLQPLFEGIAVTCREGAGKFPISL